MGRILMLSGQDKLSLKGTQRKSRCFFPSLTLFYLGPMLAVAEGIFPPEGQNCHVEGTKEAK